MHKLSNPSPCSTWFAAWTRNTRASSRWPICRRTSRSLRYAWYRRGVDGCVLHEAFFCAYAGHPFPAMLLPCSTPVSLLPPSLCALLRMGSSTAGKCTPTWRNFSIGTQGMHARACYSSGAVDLLRFYLIFFQNRFSALGV